MIGKVLESIEGIGVYAVVALVLFVAAFTLMLIKVLRMKRDDVEALGRLPLEPADAAGTEGDRSHG
jgi:hypothetical protein